MKPSHAASLVAFCLAVLLGNAGTAESLQGTLTPLPREPLSDVPPPTDDRRATGERDDGIPAAELVKGLRASTRDGTAAQKTRACQLISARLLRLHHDASEGARLDLSELATVRVPLMTLASEDPDERVRRNAVVAVGLLEFATRIGNRLSESLAESLRNIYQNESSPAVRVEVVRSLALADFDGGDDARQATLLAALGDPSAGVVMFAVRGLGRLRSEKALPALFELLRDGETPLRLMAASALQQYGAALTPHADVVRRLAASERDATIRAILGGALENMQAP